MISAEPSPAPSRNGTLSRKPSTAANNNPMAGRPLPPPPPVGPKSSPPPPALPKKSASVSQMGGMMSQSARYPASTQRQPGIPMPANGGVSRRDSNVGQNRYPGGQPKQYPQYPQPFASPNMQYPAQKQYPPNNQYPSQPQYPQDDWNRGNQASYLDEMRFAPKVSKTL